MSISKKKLLQLTGIIELSFCCRMCDIIHKRMYQVWLRFDALFRFSEYSKIQQQLLSTIHSLTNSVSVGKAEAFKIHETKLWRI